MTNVSNQSRRGSSTQRGGAAIGNKAAAAEESDDTRRLTCEDIIKCKDEALASVTVPPTIIQMLVDLRGFIQVLCVDRLS